MGFFKKHHQMRTAESAPLTLADTAKDSQSLDSYNIREHDAKYTKEYIETTLRRIAHYPNYTDMETNGKKVAKIIEQCIDEYAVDRPWQKSAKKVLQTAMSGEVSDASTIKLPDIGIDWWPVESMCMNFAEQVRNYADEHRNGAKLVKITDLINNPCASHEHNTNYDTGITYIYLVLHIAYVQECHYGHDSSHECINVDDTTIKVVIPKQGAFLSCVIDYQTTSLTPYNNDLTRINSEHTEKDMSYRELKDYIAKFIEDRLPGLTLASN